MIHIKYYYKAICKAFHRLWCTSRLLYTFQAHIKSYQPINVRIKAYQPIEVKIKEYHRISATVRYNDNIGLSRFILADGSDLILADGSVINIKG